MRREAISHLSVRHPRATISTAVDPTGALPRFVVVDAETIPSTDPTGWETGSWSGTWDADTGEIVALGPTVGAPSGADVTVAAGDEFVVWVYALAGTETICEPFLLLTVRAEE